MLLQKKILRTFSQEKHWIFFKEIDNLNESYSKLLYDFSLLYEESFPKLEIKIKQKNLISPWINKGIKQKQKLYKNFLNRENNKIK